MNIQIKNRCSDKVILEGEAENFKELLEKNKGANLLEADLSGVNLSGANLWGAKILQNQKDDLIISLRIKIIE